MYFFILVQKNQSFDQITGILSNPIQIKYALYPQLIINIAIAILKNHTQLLFGLKLSINIDQVAMTQLRKLSSLSDKCVHIARHLETFLEYFFHRIDHICLFLLTKVNMGPFTNSQQLAHLEIVVPTACLGLGTHGNRIQAYLIQSCFLIRVFNYT